MQHAGALSFLVAEDDATTGRTFARTLNRHGKAEVVRTYKAARIAIESNDYSAIVVDVGLPDGSGLDLVATVRARDMTLPILVVSGEVDAWRLAEAHALRAYYLLKPIDVAQLELFVARAGAQPAISQVRLRDFVGRWATRYKLTPAEEDLLTLAAVGTPRGELHEERGTFPSTVKKQVQNILAKTGDGSIDAMVTRLLRELLAQT